MSYKIVGCISYKFKNGEICVFNIAASNGRFHAVNTSIIRNSLEECCKALLDYCKKEDNKTPAEIQRDADMDRFYAHIYQAGYAYACGYHN